MSRQSAKFAYVVALALFFVACVSQAVDTKKSISRIELAKDFLQRGELEAAEKEAKQALVYDETSAEAENLLGLVNFMRGHKNFRLLEIEDCLTGVDADGLRAELDQFMKVADQHLARAVELDPEFGEAWSNRGSVAMQLEEYQVAADHFNKALALPGRLIDIGVTRSNLAWAYFNLKDFPKAANELRHAKTFNPTMCAANYRLGRVYFERQEYAKAQELLQMVVSDRTCPLQEAYLYLLKTNDRLGMNSSGSSGTTGSDELKSRCVDAAPKSCVAAQCKMVP